MRLQFGADDPGPALNDQWDLGAAGELELRATLRLRGGQKMSHVSLMAVTRYFAAIFKDRSASWRKRFALD